MSFVRLTTLLAASVVAVPCAAQTQEPAGRILWTVGQVERVSRDGTISPLAKGDPVFEGDVIRSASGSQAQLVMRDEALVAVRSESQLRLTTYAYAGREDGTERAVVELLKGGLRSVTGAIGRTNKDNYQLKSNGHLVGIRGTDHETFLTDAGTFNRVTLGGTYLQSAQGRVELQPGEIGFASHLPGDRPSRLERTPEFMHIAAFRNGNTGPQFRANAQADTPRPAAATPEVSPSAGAKPPASPALSSQSLDEGEGKKLRTRERNRDRDDRVRGNKRDR